MSDTSKGPWTIRELTVDEYPGTQLRYAVRDAEGEVVSIHHHEEDARLMASVPVMIQLRAAWEAYESLRLGAHDANGHLRILLEMQQKIRTVLATLEEEK